MLSSRNKDLVPDGAGVVRLEQVRTELQKSLEAERLCGEQLLEVWINETAGAEAGDANAWEQCMRRIGQADLVAVIYNGHAGWARDAGGNGICQDEFLRTWEAAPSKLRLITLEFPSDAARNLVAPGELAQQTPANRRFAQLIDQLQLFRGAATDRASLIEQVRLAVVKGVTDLAGAGAREGRRGKHHLGSSLDWSRLSYAQRKGELEKTLREFLVASFGAVSSGDGLVLRLGKARVLLVPHGVPAGFGQAEARELVGRPFLRDHERITEGSDWVGPLHLIACHKSCTETQVINFLGHPDLYLVRVPFGWFAADQLNFVQAVFLTDCADQGAATSACEQLFDWLKVSGEEERLVVRARSRAKVLKVLAKEQGVVKGRSGG